MIAILRSPNNSTIIYRIGANAWTIPYGYINNVIIKKNKGVYKILLKFIPDAYSNTITSLEFPYADVTFPASTSPQDLVNKIISDNSQQPGVETFTALGGQTQFDFEKQKFGLDVWVVVNGVGVADSQYTVNTDNIVFNNPMAGGEEVKIFVL